jgi:hypothetical protein
MPDRRPERAPSRRSLAKDLVAAGTGSFGPMDRTAALRTTAALSRTAALRTTAALWRTAARRMTLAWPS